MEELKTLLEVHKEALIDPGYQWLGNRVLLYLLNEAETPSGIVIPDSAQKRPYIGVVIATGPGKQRDNGTIEPISIHAGEVVILTKYGGEDLPEFKNFIIVYEHQIYSVIAGIKAEIKYPSSGEYMSEPMPIHAPPITPGYEVVENECGAITEEDWKLFHAAAKAPEIQPHQHQKIATAFTYNAPEMLEPESARDEAITRQLGLTDQQVKGDLNPLKFYVFETFPASVGADFGDWYDNTAARDQGKELEGFIPEILQIGVDKAKQDDYSAIAIRTYKKNTGNDEPALYAARLQWDSDGKRIEDIPGKFSAYELLTRYIPDYRKMGAYTIRLDSESIDTSMASNSTIVLTDVMHYFEFCELKIALMTPAFADELKKFKSNQIKEKQTEILSGIDAARIAGNLKGQNVVRIGISRPPLTPGGMANVQRTEYELYVLMTEYFDLPYHQQIAKVFDDYTIPALKVWYSLDYTKLVDWRGVYSYHQLVEDLVPNLDAMGAVVIYGMFGDSKPHKDGMYTPDCVFAWGKTDNIHSKRAENPVLMLERLTFNEGQ